MDADQQILRGSAATLSWQNLDGNGEPAAPAGTVTVGILRDDGTELVAAGTATAGTGSDPRTYALAATANTLLDRLVVTWTDGGDASVHVTYVEVVAPFHQHLCCFDVLWVGLIAAEFSPQHHAEGDFVHAEFVLL